MFELRFNSWYEIIIMKSQVTNEPSCADPFEADSIRVKLAIERIESSIDILREIEVLTLRDCLGRINAATVTSPINVPGHRNSAMDGYALSSNDLSRGESRFEIIGKAFAGKPFDQSCVRNQCVRIMTGALMPPGTDTVIMQEQANLLEDNLVQVGSNHKTGENTREAGEDVQQGEQILAPGDKIGAADLGVLASLGIASLVVKRKPTVAFFSTGDELVPISKPLEKGQIHDSNRYTLYGMLANLEVDIIDLGVIRDDPHKIRQALLDAASKADLIITTGGVSVGEADYIKPILAEIGQTEFWKIAIKPGRPLTFGKIGESIFIGLPGNPVAVMVTFHLFVIPAIRKLAGAKAATVPILKARSLETLGKKPGRMEIQRGIAEYNDKQEWQVGKTGKQGSGILTSMSRANCFIILNEENEGVQAGEWVDIQFFEHAGI